MGAEKIVLWLIEQGADLSALDVNKQTPIDIAKKNGHDKLAQKMSEIGDQNSKRALQHELGHKISVQDTNAHVSTATTVKSGNKTFNILSTITPEEAEALYQQERIRIPFKEGQKLAKASLGEGNFGRVGLAKFINAEGKVLYVSVKDVTGRDIETSEMEDKHHYLLNKLSNIIPFYGSVLDYNTRYQFMGIGGLGSGRDVGKKIHKLIDYGQLNENEIQSLWIHIAKSLFTGLKAMHSINAFHQDMKPTNFVISGWGELFIIDFGCMVKLDPNIIDYIVKASSFGDASYISYRRFMCIKDPNFCAKYGFNIAKEDVWMAGVALLEMMKNFSSDCLFPPDEVLHNLKSNEDILAIYEKKISFYSGT